MGIFKLLFKIYQKFGFFFCIMLLVLTDQYDKRGIEISKELIDPDKLLIHCVSYQNVIYRMSHHLIIVTLSLCRLK